MITLLSPKNGACVSLHTNEQRRLLDGDYLTDTTENDGSFPAPVIIEFEPRSDATVTLTRTKDKKTSTYQAKNGKAEIYNLTVGDEYIWQVRIGFMTSEVRAFKTVNQAPRLIRIDGISNVRDIGGYVATNETALRQGLLFRSSELDCHFQISDTGKRQLTDELGIKTEIDLRGINGESAKATLDGVTHLRFPLAAYGEIFEENQKELYRRIFTLLSDRSIYPALIHCWSGADRTGTLCYVLGALLGVDEGELELDYELSSFSVCGSRSVNTEDFKKFKSIFYSFGSTARAASENFLHSCGVDSQTVEKIREIFKDLY